MAISEKGFFETIVTEMRSIKKKQEELQAIKIKVLCSIYLRMYMEMMWVKAFNFFPPYKKNFSTSQNVQVVF